MDITDFLKRSNEFGLGRVANPIADLARQCIRIGSKPKKDHDVDVGESKLGGDPDVPDDFAWPSWQDVKLAFLIQINLSEIAGISPAINLPERGMLSFFYHPDQATWGFDPKDRGSWRTYFFSDTSKLRRMSTPKLNGNYVDKFYNSCSLSFNVDTSYPYPTSDFIRELNLIKEEQNAYWDFYDSTKFSTPEHQLLGYPSIIQNPMEIECQFVTSGVYLGDSKWLKHQRFDEIKSGYKDWRLLLQLDSDGNAEMMWGDAGMLYFWIKEDNLLKGNFSDTWMFLQCS